MPVIWGSPGEVGVFSAQINYFPPQEEAERWDVLFAHSVLSTGADLWSLTQIPDLWYLTKPLSFFSPRVACQTRHSSKMGKTKGSSPESTLEKVGVLDM